MHDVLGQKLRGRLEDNPVSIRLPMVAPFLFSQFADERLAENDRTTTAAVPHWSVRPRGRVHPLATSGTVRDGMTLLPTDLEAPRTDSLRAFRRRAAMEDPECIRRLAR